MREEGSLLALFHGVAQVHHHHIVGDVAHHAQVVRDEQIGQAKVLLQIGQQVEHLRLNRDIQRGDRLVGHDQRGLEHQRAGNGDALALPTREHVRVALVMFGAQADQGQHGARLFGTLGCRQVGIDFQWRFQNGANLFARVE